jgi:hypothetical protein
MTQSKRNRIWHPRARQGSSLAYIGLASLSLISCVAVSAAMVGVGHAQPESECSEISRRASTGVTRPNRFPGPAFFC